jgi:hypothetical protein
MGGSAGPTQNDRRTATRAIAAPSGSAARLGRATTATATTVFLTLGPVSRDLHAAGRSRRASAGRTARMGHLSSVRPAAA